MCRRNMHPVLAFFATMLPSSGGVPAPDDNGYRPQ